MTAVRDSDRLLGVALRGRHDAAFDALVRRAGVGRSARALAGSLAAGEPLPLRVVGQPTTLPYLGALATAWFGAGRDPVEQQAAVELYRQVLERHGPTGLRRVERRHYLQAAFLVGRHDLVRRGLETLPDVSADVTQGLLADLVNPYAVGTQTPAAHDRWEDLLGSRFRSRGLVGPSVDGSRLPAFDGLRLRPSRSVDGPMVTVVVPAYRPERGLVTAVASVLAQSYGHLEVLLVDDASGPDFESIFAECVDLDERVTLLRLGVNGGSYLARNAALEVARGDFVTTQDADDWSHPERLAHQVEALVSAPHAAASRSVAIRARPDLTRQWFGYRPERMNASSLMVRRDMLQRVGGFDSIRKGADSELQERLALVGGVVDVLEPLAITRLAAGSLSRADFSLGRHSPDRVLFRSAFRHWHNRLAEDGVATPEGAVLRREGPRPFPVPRTFVQGLPGITHPGHLRLVVVVDRADPCPVALDDRLVALVQGRGDPVGVLGREDLTRAGDGPSPWRDELLEAARDGRIELLTDTDVVHADTLLVLEPSTLAVPPTPALGITADRVLVAAVPPAADEPPRDLEAVGTVVRRLFGCAPEWRARSDTERLLWEQEGWAMPLLADGVLRSAPGGVP